MRQDQAAALYSNAPIGLAMSAIASAGVAFLVESPQNRAWLIGWTCLMALVLAVRAFDVVVGSKTRLGAARAIRRYGLGVSGACVLWIAFPLLFFPSMGVNGRAGAAVVLASMAAGSPLMLGAVVGIAVSYCLALTVPFSILFLLQADRADTVLGALGLFYAVVMIASCMVLHRRITGFMLLARNHQVLMEEAVGQKLLTEAAHREIQEVNRTLEARVRQRTVHLEREIAERRATAQALARVASTDPLTGLLNRATLTERLIELMADALRSGDSFAVLFLDLDGFKQINDVQGHGLGDHVLKVLAERLAACCEDAQVARWGGDEFVIAARRSTVPEDLVAYAESLGAALSLPIPADPDHGSKRTVRAGVSVGIAVFPQHGTSQEELIGAADLAMYAAKKEGGGRIVIFNPVLARRVGERRLIEHSLRSAPSDGALTLHYQPIINVASGHCDVMEALLRWNHPELGRIGPDVFVPIAEQSEQIVAIGRFVLHQACSTAMRWPGDEPPAVSVNISIAQILSGHLLADVQSALDESGLPASRLHLEITESMFAGDTPRMMPVLDALRSRGVRLALDDFGTGFSSLARLKTLPIDTIKIDKAFVQEESEQGSAIIRAMLQISRAMQLDVTAEGVETESQRLLLSRLGATRLQGYLLSRPMPAALVPGWLAARPALETTREPVRDVQLATSRLRAHL